MSIGSESGAKVAGKAPMKHSPFSSSSTSSFPKWFQRSTDDNYDAFRQFTKGRYTTVKLLSLDYLRNVALRLQSHLSSIDLTFSQAPVET
jgi:hypothetical protein